MPETVNSGLKFDFTCFSPFYHIKYNSLRKCWHANDRY